ncbi:MAG: response regulator [Gammaproteobacteria bacterium]|nr:response regulator [Gammaproteobacteria bacterium]
MSRPKATHEADAELQAIIHALPYFLYVIDASGQVTHLNGKLLTVFGLSTIQDMNASIYDYFDKKLSWMSMRSKLLQQTDQEALASEQAQYDVLEPPVTDLRGLVFHYEATRVPLKNKDGACTGLMVCLVDVTARRYLELQARATLSEAENMQAERRPYPANMQRDPSKSPKVLLIEDNPIAKQSVQAMLVGLLCQVDTAETEAELDKCFQLGKYDFILMDIGLEGTTGYLLAKHIRQLEKDSGYCVPIIALTGFDADVVKTDCDYYFMEGAITKPLMIEQARQLIQRYVYMIPNQIKGLKSLRMR